MYKFVHIFTFNSLIGSSSTAVFILLRLLFFDGLPDFFFLNNKGFSFFISTL